MSLNLTQLDLIFSRLMLFLFSLSESAVPSMAGLTSAWRDLRKSIATTTLVVDWHACRRLLTSWNVPKEAQQSW